jgi:hypothetical protein
VDPADDSAGEHGLLCGDVAFPVRGFADAQRAPHLAIALDAARNHERAGGDDVTHDRGAFGNDGGRKTKAVGESAFGFVGHGHTIQPCSNVLA